MASIDTSAASNIVMTNLSDEPSSLNSKKCQKVERNQNDFGSLSLMHQISQKNFAQKSMIGGKLLKFKGKENNDSCFTGKQTFAYDFNSRMVNCDQMFINSTP